MDVTIPLVRKPSVYRQFFTGELKALRFGSDAWLTSTGYNATYGTLFDTGSTASEVPADVYSKMLAQIRNALPSVVKRTEVRGYPSRRPCTAAPSRCARRCRLVLRCLCAAAAAAALGQSAQL